MSEQKPPHRPEKVVARIVRCPACGKSVEYSERNAFRPFCSQRCRTNDLGAWAEGRYAIPAENRSDEGSQGEDESPLNSDDES